MMTIDPRSIVVKSGLRAGEFIELSRLAESRGLSRSALIRSLVKDAIFADSARAIRVAQVPKWSDNVVPVAHSFDRSVTRRG